MENHWVLFQEKARHTGNAERLGKRPGKVRAFLPLEGLGPACGLGAAVSEGLSHVEEFSLVKFSPQHRVGPWSIQDTGIVFGFV